MPPDPIGLHRSSAARLNRLVLRTGPRSRPGQNPTADTLVFPQDWARHTTPFANADRCFPAC